MSFKIKYLNYITLFLAVSTVALTFASKYLHISKMYSILLLILTIVCYWISREITEKEMKIGKSSKKMKEMIKEQLDKKE